jgi:hypothetical protein
MSHIIRIYLEHKEDVIREVEIPSNKILEDLHFTIIELLNLNKMASFDMTNEDSDEFIEYEC